MPVKYPPVVILSAVNWDFLWQRHQTFATHFARAGHRVIFVEDLLIGANYDDPSYYRRAATKLWRKARRTGRKGQKTGLPHNLTVYSVVMAPPKPRAFRLVNKQIFTPRILRSI